MGSDARVIQLPQRGAATATSVATESPPAHIDAGTLSQLFIESLDAMIGGVAPAQASWPDWPSTGDETLERTAVDVVGLLCGFVQDDQELPAGLKTALAQLQIPLLQLAMRDTGFFADWRHPGRRLLDALPRLYREYRRRGGGSAEFERFATGRLAALGETTRPSREDFAALLVALESFATGAPVQPQHDAATAWTHAEEAAREILARGLPPLLRDFLAAFWVDALQRTALAHGVDSPQWHDAVAVVDDLAWSLAPKTAQHERLQLVGELPALLARVHRGLDLAGVTREERREFFDALGAAHTAILGSGTRAAAAPARQPESAIDQVRRMRRGDWVQFVMSDGSRARHRLTWISPQRGLLVFSNQHGERALQLDPEELAELVRARQATIVFDQPDAATERNSA